MRPLFFYFNSRNHHNGRAGKTSLFGPCRPLSHHKVDTGNTTQIPHMSYYGILLSFPTVPSPRTYPFIFFVSYPALFVDACRSRLILTSAFIGEPKRKHQRCGGVERGSGPPARSSVCSLLPRLRTRSDPSQSAAVMEDD